MSILGPSCPTHANAEDWYLVCFRGESIVVLGVLFFVVVALVGLGEGVRDCERVGWGDKGKSRTVQNPARIWSLGMAPQDPTADII